MIASFTLFILFISVLVSVAFFTLFERKLLGYIQLRKGPNKVGFVGLLQPFSDAVKLFSKEVTNPLVSNFFPYMLSPVVALFLALVVWGTLPSMCNLMDFDLSLLFFLCCTSLGVYTLLGAGWSSNSKYALLGALRAVAQTISYEVSLALILLCIVVVAGSYSLRGVIEYQMDMSFIYLFPLIGLVWFVSCLAETNRTPFDFAEGESELVSGYNVEYSSGGFALIMMAEYTSILFMSALFVVLFFGGAMFKLSYLGVMITSFVFVWVRGTLPRYRYDKLMGLAWKSFLPFALFYLVFICGILVFI